MTIDEEFLGLQRNLIHLILQNSKGRSRYFSQDLLNHFNCKPKEKEQKDFRKALRQFLICLDDKHRFTIEEKEAFERSCKILEKENKPTCCTIF